MVAANFEDEESHTPKSAYGQRHAGSMARLRAVIWTALLWSVFAAAVLCASPAHAEQPGDTACAIHLRMFVLSIDKLFARRDLDQEAYYEIIRNDLPDKGCSVEEALSIFQTSKFYVKGPSPPSQYERGLADYVIEFKNEDLHVSFGLDKKTGRISYPAVTWNEVFP